VFDTGGTRPRPLALFPDDRAAPRLDCEVVQVRLNQLPLRRPRQWGACWLACQVWERLPLGEFWSAKLPPARHGTRWLNVFKTWGCYRLLDPGRAWRLHRHWYEHSAMADLLGEEVALVQIAKLYRCLDQLLAHKEALFTFWRRRCSTSVLRCCCTT
jgi:hypothetical protein